MDTAGLIFTAIGTAAGVVAAYFGWVAIRPQRGTWPRRSRSANSLPQSTETEPEMAASYDAFISYSHADLEWVADFCEDLEKHGLKIARDEIFLDVGDVLVHAVEKAIRESSNGILVFSPDSLTSDWVKQEYATLMQRSIEEDRRFIPVVIKNVELPAFAATRYYADFRSATPARRSELIERIAVALKAN
ncbi:TIR domain-containing protein [Actinomadura sp. GC306]|uniref:toll/interleukin-1 receptor domain-containing protein n=1 Tax=Actinomadura sp. GC306 TaxID=2530367 RepID=UPI0010460EEE|nr:toll/interleukin-1 receptor domain-containing protein [Actinomadura sp. GC306]TDC65788.1 TIR domain-containing protein [Actinomadura sp. GC306]